MDNVNGLNFILKTGMGCLFMLVWIIFIIIIYPLDHCSLFERSSFNDLNGLLIRARVMIDGGMESRSILPAML